MSQLAPMAGCPKPQITTLPLAAGAHTQVMGLMGQTPVNSMVGVHERSVIDSRNSRHRTKRWLFWARWEGRAIAFAWPNRSFCPAWYRSVGGRSGVSPYTTPRKFEKRIFGVFSASHSPSDRAFVLLPVAKRSSEVTCLWAGRRRRLGGVFCVGRSGGLWRVSFSVVWVETVLDLGVFSGLDGIVFDFE